MRFNLFVLALLSLSFTLPVLSADKVGGEKPTTLQHEPVLKEYQKFDHAKELAKDNPHAGHDMQHDHSQHDASQHDAHQHHEHAGHEKQPIAKKPVQPEHSHGE